MVLLTKKLIEHTVKVNTYYQEHKERIVATQKL